VLRFANVEINAADRELRLVAPESGRIVLEQAGQAITVDLTSGCILVNGQLPPQSPCRSTMIGTPSPLSNLTTISSLSRPVIATWVLIVVSLAMLICGGLIGCFLGYCSAKYRMRRVASV
jgi:hypothetical protein